VKVATWQYTLGSRVRDAIAAYYARYPDATPAEVEAWLRDRGFNIGPTDVEEYMAALDSHPGWRTGWINRNIHRYSAAFDPDAFLATRGYGEDDGWQVAEDELEEPEGQEYEDDEWEDDRQGKVVTATAPALPRPLGGEDRLPGIALAVLGLAATVGVTALIIAVLR
jgi:hypothetical protein